MSTRFAHFGCLGAMLGLAACGSTSDRTSRTAAVADKRPAPALVLPIERNGHYVLEFGNIVFDVVPAGG